MQELRLQHGVRLMATIREALALIRLYRACDSEVERSRARELVPELVEFDETRGPVAFAPAPDAERWLLKASAADGTHLGHQRVVCSAANLEVYKADFAANFDLATELTIEAERIA
jgi:hypothetical protein